MHTGNLVLESSISLATVSIADLAKPHISQLTKANALPTNAEESNGTLLLAPELPKEPSSPKASRFKWTPAVVALTTSIGGAVLYQIWNSSQQDVIPAADTAIPDTESIQPEQADVLDAAPIPVPEAPTEFDVGPNFSQSQVDNYFARAYHHAKAKDFSKALIYLEQVPQQTGRYLEAQAKIAEYSKKREIKAKALLSEAYRWAAIANFEQALTYLHQVPTHTEAYRKAFEKITEYREKQELLAAHQLSLG
jgi:hypothetical protein